MICITKAADKQLLRLPKSIRTTIAIKIEQLTNPSNLNIKRLENSLNYRLRVGDYRIIYSINSRTKEITILSVAHRKEAYR